LFLASSAAFALLIALTAFRVAWFDQRHVRRRLLGGPPDGLRRVKG
jgi:hypothetical protein